MKNKSIIMILITLLVFSLASCKNKKTKETSTTAYKTEQKTEQKIVYKEDDFINNSTTEYVIVYSKDLDTTKDTYYACKELKSYLNICSGVEVRMISDEDVTYSENAKYLSVGKNKLYEAVKEKLDTSDLGPSGIIVKTIGKSIFMVANNEFSNVYAVYEFLERVYDFNVYASDEIFYKTNVTSMKLPDLNVKEIPSFEYRVAKYGCCTTQARKLFRQNTEYDFICPTGSIIYHNSFQVLPVDQYFTSHPNWYSDDGQQICYTCRGNKDEQKQLIDTAASYLVECLLKYPDANGIGFMQQDVAVWCTCEECTKLKNKYGAESATLVNFMNLLSKRCDELLKAAGDKRTEVIYWFFAYNKTTSAPVKTVSDGVYELYDGLKFNDNVGVIYAPILMDFTKTMNDSSNTGYREVFKKWAVICENIYFWGYDTMFMDFFNPLNTYGTCQTNLQIAHDNNVKAVMLQGQYDAKGSSHFSNFKVYLHSKLEWNVNEDYNKLYNDFFDNYFKDASETMKKLFTSFETHLTYISTEYNLYCQDGVNTLEARNFPKGTLLGWLALIDEAYKDIESLKATNPEVYTKLYNRINLESLCYRYILIKLYGTDYLDSELKEMKESFRSDCGNLGVTHFYEHITIDKLWQNWGMA